MSLFNVYVEDEKFSFDSYSKAFAFYKQCSESNCKLVKILNTGSFVMWSKNGDFELPKK